MVFSLLFFGAAQSGIACCYLGNLTLSPSGTLLSLSPPPSLSDIAPRYSSIMNTLGNTVGALAGLAGPLVVSALLGSYPDTTAWQIVFFLTFLQSAVALVVFYFYQADHIIEVLNNPVRG
jgi:MFS family permease